MGATMIKKLCRPRPRLRHSRAGCGGDPAAFLRRTKKLTTLGPRVRGDDGVFEVSQ